MTYTVVYIFNGNSESAFETRPTRGQGCQCLTTKFLGLHVHVVIDRFIRMISQNMFKSQIDHCVLDQQFKYWVFRQS